jgi:DNA-binding transcriptional ArsR family regulator
MTCPYCDTRNLNRRVLDTLKQRGPLDLVELVAELHLTPRTISEALDELREAGLVARGLTWDRDASDDPVYAAVDR